MNMKKVIAIAKLMYNVNTVEKIPIPVLVALEDAHNLCLKASGELISRQVIAGIILQHDPLRCFARDSVHYVGL